MIGKMRQEAVEAIAKTTTSLCKVIHPDYHDLVADVVVMVTEQNMGPVASVLSKELKYVSEVSSFIVSPETIVLAALGNAVAHIQAYAQWIELKKSIIQ